MNIWFLTAGMLMFAVTAVHVFLGGKKIARPLLDNLHLNSQSRYTNYFCWHMVTILLIMMGVGFIYAAWVPTALELAVFGVILCVIEVIANVALIMVFKLKPLRHPQFLMFSIVAGFGGFGLVS